MTRALKILKIRGYKGGGAIFHSNITDLACVKILKVKMSYFRAKLTYFWARKVRKQVPISIKIAANIELGQNVKIS